jgi:predicted XRE-type DNA-binding protein
MSKLKMTKSSGNVFKDLGFNQEEAANLKIRAEMVILIREHIRKHKLSQKDAAKLLGIQQPDVSAIMKLRIEKFTIDRLVNFLTRLNHKVEISSKPGRHRFEVIDTGKIVRA